ncbi:hypothetical protein ERJ75_000870400 [Trypanosoma vivax]|nr:hypothetical protein ERJ75_000870400 [Trypanosoma vivax]
MVEVTYPKTVQWIAGIVARCTNSPHLLHSSATVTDLVDVLFTPATSAPSCSQCEVSRSKQLANGIAAALNCSGQDEERDEGQEHTLGLESGNVSTAFALSEGSQVLQRHHSADSPWSPLLNGAEVNENSVSGEVADGELPGEAEDHELGLDFLMSSSEVHAQQQEDEYEEDEDEDANEEYDYDEEIDEEDEAEVNEEMFNEEELKELKLEEEELWALRRCKKGVWGSAPCGEAEDVSVSDFLLQRSKIFLSDLIILSALQHLARVIADGRREVCMSSLPTKVCDVGAELLPSMKEAAEFVLALSQHPFVSWRMAVEEDFLMAKTAALTRDEEGKTGALPLRLCLFRFAMYWLHLDICRLRWERTKGKKRTVMLLTVSVLRKRRRSGSCCSVPRHSFAFGAVGYQVARVLVPPHRTPTYPVRRVTRTASSLTVFHCLRRLLPGARACCRTYWIRFGGSANLRHCWAQEPHKRLSLLLIRRIRLSTRRICCSALCTRLAHRSYGVLTNTVKKASLDPLMGTYRLVRLNSSPQLPGRRSRRRSLQLPHPHDASGSHRQVL